MLPSNHTKRSLLERLQRAASVDFLRKHRIFGNLSCIRRSRNLSHIRCAYLLYFSSVKSEECISLLNACEEAINTTNSIPWDPKWLKFIGVWENAQNSHDDVETLSDEDKKYYELLNGKSWIQDDDQDGINSWAGFAITEGSDSFNESNRVCDNSELDKNLHLRLNEIDDGNASNVLKYVHKISGWSRYIYN